MADVNQEYRSSPADISRPYACYHSDTVTPFAYGRDGSQQLGML